MIWGKRTLTFTFQGKHKIILNELALNDTKPPKKVTFEIDDKTTTTTTTNRDEEPEVTSQQVPQKEPPVARSRGETGYVPETSVGDRELTQKVKIFHFCRREYFFTFVVVKSFFSLQIIFRWLFLIFLRLTFQDIYS